MRPRTLARCAVVCFISIIGCHDKTTDPTTPFQLTQAQLDAAIEKRLQSSPVLREQPFDECLFRVGHDELGYRLGDPGRWRTYDIESAGTGIRLPEIVMILKSRERHHPRDSTNSVAATQY